MIGWFFLQFRPTFKKQLAEFGNRYLDIHVRSTGERAHYSTNLTVHCGRNELSKTARLSFHTLTLKVKSKQDCSYQGEALNVPTAL